MMCSAWEGWHVHNDWPAWAPRPIYFIMKGEDYLKAEDGHFRTFLTRLRATQLAQRLNKEAN